MIIAGVERIPCANSSEVRIGGSSNRSEARAVQYAENSLGQGTSGGSANPQERTSRR